MSKESSFPYRLTTAMFAHNPAISQFEHSYNGSLSGIMRKLQAADPRDLENSVFSFIPNVEATKQYNFTTGELITLRGLMWIMVEDPEFLQKIYTSP